MLLRIQTARIIVTGLCFEKLSQSMAESIENNVVKVVCGQIFR